MTTSEEGGRCFQRRYTGDFKSKAEPGVHCYSSLHITYILWILFEATQYLIKTIKWDDDPVKYTAQCGWHMLGAHSSSSCFTINILEKIWAKLSSGSLVAPILLGRWKTIGWDSRSIQGQRQTSLFAPSPQSYNLVIYANFTKNKYLTVSFSFVSWFLPL